MRLITCFVASLLWISPWAHAASLQLPPSQTYTLDNGARVILTPSHDVPMIVAEIAIRGGALADAQGKEGSAALLSDLLLKGAGSRDAKAFVEASADVGGELSLSTAREALWASANFHATDADLMLSLLADALQRPHLAQAEFDKLQTRAIQSLAAVKDGDPRALLTTYGDAWLFRNHPYGRPVKGSEASLKAITLDDLKQYFRAQVGADRAIISIAGDFDPDIMRGAVQKAFGEWHKASAAEPSVVAAERQSGARVLLVDKPGATQTYFWIGQVGVAIDDPAYAAQNLVQTLFGGRFTSMLNTELRVKSGLTYGAGAGLARFAQPGAAYWFSYTRTDATAKAIDLGLEVQARLQQQALSTAQITSARNYVLGQFAPNYQTLEQIAEALANLVLYHQDRARLESYDAALADATNEAVNAARAVFPAGRDYAMVVIGDAQLIGKDISRYGQVTRMRITDPGFLPAAQ